MVSDQVVTLTVIGLVFVMAFVLVSLFIFQIEASFFHDIGISLDVELLAHSLAIL